MGQGKARRAGGAGRVSRDSPEGQREQGAPAKGTDTKAFTCDGSSLRRDRAGSQARNAYVQIKFHLLLRSCGQVP